MSGAAGVLHEGICHGIVEQVISDSAKGAAQAMVQTRQHVLRDRFQRASISTKDAGMEIALSRIRSGYIAITGR